jgi:osmoprotectant transport system permease protein
MNLMWDYLSDGDNWNGSGGIADRAMEHVALCLGALLIAAVIALAIGTMVGHGRRGDDLPIALGTLGRLMAPLGVFCYFALKFDTGSDAVLFALVLLAIPPMMTAAYAGVRLVDAGAVESARAAGMLPGQILRQVEIPMALPDLIEGIRKSSRQVVAMAAVGAFVGAGGLGRLIIDGQSDEFRDYGMVATGGVLIALLAVILDTLIVMIGHQFISPGLTRRTPARSRPRPAGAATYPTVPGAPPGPPPPPLDT